MALIKKFKRVSQKFFKLLSLWNMFSFKSAYILYLICKQFVCGLHREMKHRHRVLDFENICVILKTDDIRKINVCWKNLCLAAELWCQTAEGSTVPYMKLSQQKGNCWTVAQPNIHIYTHSDHFIKYTLQVPGWT